MDSHHFQLCAQTARRPVSTSEVRVKILVVFVSCVLDVPRSPVSVLSLRSVPPIFCSSASLVSLSSVCIPSSFPSRFLQRCRASVKPRLYKKCTPSATVHSPAGVKPFFVGGCAKSATAVGPLVRLPSPISSCSHQAHPLALSSPPKHLFACYLHDSDCGHRVPPAVGTSCPTRPVLWEELIVKLWVFSGCPNASCTIVNTYTYRRS